MSDQSAFPLPPDVDWGQWMNPGPLMPMPDPPQISVGDADGVVLSLEDTVRVREQAVYTAAMMAPDLSVFEDDDEAIADRTVEVAKRFERYIRSGQ